MKLSSAARFFDRVSVYHPDTLSFLFKCQIDNFDGSRRDAFAAYRRLMTTDAECQIPETGAIRLWDRVWLVGESQNDGWDTVHRVNHILHQCSGKATVRTVAQFLAGEAGTTEWADCQWLTSRKEEAYSSENPQEYGIFMRLGAVVPEHAVITADGQTFLCKYNRPADSGFRICVTMLQKDATPVSVQFIERSFVPGSGGYVDGVSRPVPAMLVRWQEFFQYEEEITAKYEHGDVTVLVRKEEPVTKGLVMQVRGRRWTVVNTQAGDGITIIHARPA